MIAAIVMIVVGLLLAVAAVLLRKKLGIAWLCSGVAAGVLLCACGGWFCRGELQQAQQDRESLYLGLRYLEQMQMESANYHLKKVDASDSFVSAAARTLLETMRGNGLTARIDLDIAETLARSDDQKTLLAALRRFSADDDRRLSVLIDELLRQVDLSKDQSKRLDLYAQVESGQYGDDDADTARPRKLGLSKNERERLSISTLLNSGSYEEAVIAAVRLADDRPSEENRLLLAETVAECAYHGVPLSSAAFFGGGEEDPDDDPSIVEERKELQKQLEKAERELSLLEITLPGIGDEDGSQALNQQKLELTQKIQSLTRHIDCLYVYRAFNAIADLHSLNAQLVRARLHYALLDCDQAVETLVDAANSLQARLSTDQKLKDALKVVANAYQDDNVYYENMEFRDAVTRLLAAPFDDLMYFTQSPLTQDFVQRIVSDQKIYGRSLVVSGVDTSDYPTIRVTLSGSSDVLREVVERKEVTVRDTRQDIVYTAEMTDGSTADVCMLLDRSGSMGGRPMQDLRAAVSDFIADMRTGTSLSLVAFDDYAARLTELTQDTASLLTAIEGLSDRGGTNITAAIREGISVLQEAGSIRVMLLMTDGQSSIDFSVVDEAAAKGITIHTIGFGSVNDSLLQEIADRTGGQYVRADSSEELSGVYAGLQRIIGNTVTVEYTVDDTESQQRYFYLWVKGYTVHRDYAPAGSTVRVYTSNTYFVTPEQLQRLADRENELEIELTGEGLVKVQGATVGGLPAAITTQENSRLRLSVKPSLTAGWQTIELQLANGGTLRLEHLLLVGETQTYRNIRLGSLLISSAQGILPGDGTLVLAGSGIPIRENLTDGAVSSLDLSFNGTLILPWTSAEPSETPGTGTDLGEQGTIRGFGVVTIGRGDSAYAQNVPTTVASGEVIFTCGPEQSQMTSAAETGVR